MYWRDEYNDKLDTILNLLQHQDESDAEQRRQDAYVARQEQAKRQTRIARGTVALATAAAIFGYTLAMPWWLVVVVFFLVLFGAASMSGFMRGDER